MMRSPIIVLLIIAAALLGKTQVSNAQSAYCPVLLLHESGAVQDNNVRHRRKLR